MVIIRLVHLSSTHFRLSTTIGLTEKQHRYWSREGSIWSKFKKHVFYAPLWRIRHNREIQLSKALNVGTIPSRIHLILLALYLSSNIVYCCLLDYQQQPRAALIAEIRGRTGHLAVINMVGLFILAARNNPSIPLLGMSFDTFNLFHRWIGRIIVLESLAHVTAWSINEFDAVGFQAMTHSLTTDPFRLYGLLAVIAMVIILIQSPSVLRHAFYEVFLHLHQTLALASLVAVFLHVYSQSLPQLPFMYLIIAIWTLERSSRIARILYYNITHRGMTKAIVEALDGGACRVTFLVHRSWTDRPGTHIYAYLPSVSLWMSHPFSVAWVDHTPEDPLSSLSTAVTRSSSSSSLSATTGLEHSKPSFTTAIPKHKTAISCIMATRTGMTSSLYARAFASPKHTITIRALVEGPYGHPCTLRSYGTVLLFAGGVGITNQLSHFTDLIRAHDAGLCSTKKLTLVWTVRETVQLDWIRPWLCELLSGDEQREEIGLRVEVLLYVSKPGTKECKDGGVHVDWFPGVARSGRPDIKALMEREFDERIGAMSVGVCGPGALADGVRARVRGCVGKGKGKVDFWEEAFTW